MITAVADDRVGVPAAWDGAVATVARTPASATARPALRISFSTIHSTHFVTGILAFGTDEASVGVISRQATDETVLAAWISSPGASGILLLGLPLPLAVEPRRSAIIAG
jgi:hypothetical protein